MKTLTTDEELMEECAWLGKPHKVHRIGEYQIVEHDKMNFSVKPHKKIGISFSGFVNGEDTMGIYNSLDAAIIACIAFKHNCHYELPHYIMKMFKKDKE